VGAWPGSDSLLNMPCLRHCDQRIGVNLERPGIYQGYEIIAANANDLSQFPTGRFSAVLCNSMLEHDRYFWKSIAEIHRVTASGGLIVIGVPGYAAMGLSRFTSRWSLLGILMRLIRHGQYSDMVQAGTVTLGLHDFPGDYYRFSEQAVREVFMEGLVEISVKTVLNPPRFIAWGRKP